MLAAALRRNARLRALHDLQQRLLHALARHVARDGQVLGLARHLVDLVDVDDADLGARNVEVRRGDELEQDVLNILAHVAGLGQRGGVRDGERHPQRAGQRLRQQRLARAGGAQKHDVALRKLDIAVFGVGAQADALVVVVHRHGQGTLRLLLPHHMLRKLGIQLMRGRQVGQHVLGRGLSRDGLALRAYAGMASRRRSGRRLRSLGLEAGDRQAQVAHHGVGAHGNALIANVNAVRTRDHRSHLVRAFAAEGACNVFGTPTVEFVVASVVHVSCSLLYSLEPGTAARDVVMRSTRPYATASSAVM